MDKVKSLLTIALLFQIISSILIGIIFYFSSNILADKIFKNDISINILHIFSLYFLGLNIFQTFNNFFLAIQNTFLYKLTDFIRILITLLLVIYISFFSPSLINFSIAWILGLYFGLIILIILFYKNYYKRYLENIKFHIDKGFIKELLSYAIFVVIGTSAGTILSQIDMQMILVMSGPEDAGYYTTYLSIVSIPFLLLSPIIGLLFPIISDLSAKGKQAEILKVKDFFSKNFITLGIFGGIFFYIFSDAITYTLFGEAYIKSGFILKYSIFFLTFNLLLQINFNILSGIGKVKQKVNILFQAIFINLFLNYIFINILGVYGAALATGIGWIYIWIRSEGFLTQNFSSLIDKNNIKNFLFFSCFGLLHYLLIKKFYIYDYSRGSVFLIIIVFGILWSFYFILINYKNIKITLKTLQGKKKYM